MSKRHTVTLFAVVALFSTSIGFSAWMVQLALLAATGKDFTGWLILWWFALSAQVGYLVYQMHIRMIERHKAAMKQQASRRK